MSVDYFLDTNILLYRYSKQDVQKRPVAANLLESGCAMISAQVLNEFCNVARRKFPDSYAVIDGILTELADLLVIVPIDSQDTANALMVSRRYGFSFYDSLIVAVAERHHCKMLLSEDMQHGMVLDSGLRIVNPFALLSA